MRISQCNPRVLVVPFNSTLWFTLHPPPKLPTYIPACINRLCPDNITKPLLLSPSLARVLETRSRPILLARDSFTTLFIYIFFSIIATIIHTDLPVHLTTSNCIPNHVDNPLPRPRKREGRDHRACTLGSGWLRIKHPDPRR